MRRVYPILALFASFVLLAAGCGGGEGANAPGAASPRTASEPAAPTNAASSVEDPRAPLVVFLGDSITAGYGLSESEAFPAILERRLHDSGIAARVVNAGVSGDTTAGGLRRIDWVLEQHPDVLVVGLGANDALRGQPLESVEANLRAIVERGRSAGADVLLLGMRIPTNYGRDYAEGFAAIYPKVARSRGVPLVPFALDGVGGHPALNLEDGIHPNVRGHEVVADNVYPYLKEALARRGAGETG